VSSWHAHYVPVLAKHPVTVRRRRRREGEAVELAAALDGEIARASTTFASASPRGEAEAAGGDEEEE
jgi:hypothetical protein